MIEDYFSDITIEKREGGDDGLGGGAINYVNLGTVKGLLQRASSTERMIAAQRNVVDVYTFMTKPTDNAVEIKTGYIISDGVTTAVITSSELKGNSESETMQDISQWTAEKYVKEG
jgi:hypothetical protein